MEHAVTVVAAWMIFLGIWLTLLGAMWMVHRWKLRQIRKRWRKKNQEA